MMVFLPFHANEGFLVFLSPAGFELIESWRRTVLTSPLTPHVILDLHGYGFLSDKVFPLAFHAETSSAKSDTSATFGFSRGSRPAMSTRMVA